MAGYSDRKLRTQSGGAGQVFSEGNCGTEPLLGSIAGERRDRSLQRKPRFRPEIVEQLVQQSLFAGAGCSAVKSKEACGHRASGNQGNQNGGRRACWLQQNGCVAKTLKEGALLMLDRSC